jgi:HK97 gp10 family phage protein
MPTALPGPSTVIGLGPAGSAQFELAIDWNRILNQFIQAAIGEVNKATTQAYAIAQQKVPVRRVFQERRRAPIKLNMRERVKTLNAAKQIEGGYLPSLTVQTRRSANQFFPYLRVPIKGNYTREQVARGRIKYGPRVRGDFREVGYSEELGRFELTDPIAALQLTSRGRSELRRKDQSLSAFDRAKFIAGKSHGTAALSKNPESVYKGRLGGRLKGEMYVERAKPDDTGFAGYVVSPTPYAKYVEFGTRYAAAQPYLRPAIDQIAIRYHDDMVRALQHAGRVVIGKGGLPSEPTPAVFEKRIQEFAEGVRFQLGITDEE